MNVEIMGRYGEARGVHYDFSGKEHQLEPVISTWADRWVAHRLGDYIGLDVFLENPAVIFLKLAARRDFALRNRIGGGSRTARTGRIRPARRLLEGCKNENRKAN